MYLVVNENQNTKFGGNMTCHRRKAVASVSAVFLAMIDFVLVLPASAAESQQHLPALVLAHVSDGSRPDTVLPASDAWTRRGATGFVATPALSRPHGAAERPGSVYGPSQLGGMAGRFDGVTVSDSGKKVAAAGMGRLGAVANATPSGIGEASFGGSVPHVNEETAPGPYTMLFIGLSLAAFIAFRRIAQL